MASSDPSSLSNRLQLMEDGLWCGTQHASVSYPDEGHAACLGLEEQSFWFRHRNDCILEVLGRFPPAGTVLDVGGGNGFVTLALQRAGHAAMLLEPGLDGARNARDRGLAPVLWTTLQEAQFRDHCIPAAGLFDVLEHVEDDSSFLRELHRVLTPGGRLYLTVPAFAALWSQDDVTAGHHRRYSAQQLREVLEAASFEVEFCSHFFSFLPVPLWLTRTLPSALGLRSHTDVVDVERSERDHRPPNGWVRRALSAVCTAERVYLRRGGLPWGTSLLCVARTAAPGENV
jgi:SAM-dependent methyltransferase